MATFKQRVDAEYEGRMLVKKSLNYQTLVISQTNATDWGDAAYTLTTKQSGAIILFDKDEATTVTLPAITTARIGTTYTFIETAVSINLRSVVTAYDDDIIVGGLSIGFDGTESGSIDHISKVVANAMVRVKLDGNLADGGGGVGSTFTLTAIGAGNTGSSGGDKTVWALTGHVVNQAADGDGTAFFATT